jgi:16S rRNA G527 N7-methylase RsmG
MSCEVFGQIVSRETYDKLRDYESLIQKWNPSINLVAKSTLSDIWERHIVDSAQVYYAASEGYLVILQISDRVAGCLLSLLRFWRKVQISNFK